MPAIHLFHRRTILGGDDLQPAAFIAIFTRCLQLSMLLGPIFHHIATESRKNGGLVHYILYDPSNDSSCRHSHLFNLLFVAYALASAAYSVGSMVLEWRIAHWSSQGAPTETEPRSQKVSSLLELKLVPFSIMLFVIWFTGISAVSFGPMYSRCTEESSDNEMIMVVARALQVFAVKIQLWWITLTLLLLTQMAEVLVLWFYLLQHCRQPVLDFNTSAPSYHSELEYTTPHHELVEEMWADRCATACQCMSKASCYIFGGREVLGQAEFGDVARALADYFESRGVLDVVPSDIITGLVVLQRLQRARIYKARQAVLQGLEQANSLEVGQSNSLVESGRPDSLEGAGFVESSFEVGQELFMSLNAQPSAGGSSSRTAEQSVYRFEPDGTFERHQRSLLNRNNFADMTALEEGARYAKFALAIYTWPLYVYSRPFTGVPRLCASASCHCCCGFARDSGQPSPRVSDGLVDDFGRIEGDNACEVHKTALLLTADLDEADLVYANLNSGFSDTTYAILLDHSWRSVIVSIRGTFSLEDCVTDVMIDPESLEQLGQDFGFDASNQYCHGGVLTCVRNVYRDLQRHGLLERLLLGEHARYADYSLRLVGHSLGAATCTLLGYMLRSKFPNLRCVNYSPPGCMSWDLATGCKGWCTSFVLDSDMVPRLSWNSMEILRNEILDIIGRLKVNKFEVARRVLHGSSFLPWRLFWEQKLEDKEMAVQLVGEVLYAPDEVPDSEYQEQLQRFREIQQERRRVRAAIRSINLFPPGKMIHLVKTGEKRTCLHGLAKCLTCCTTNVGSRYTAMWINNDDLNEIVVSPTMATDHFPNRICAMLEGVAQDFGLDGYR